MEKKCLVCSGEIDDPWWPICSNLVCFLILTQLVNHKEKPCWISEEIFCQREYCVDTDGMCHILKEDTELKKLGLRRNETILNCWY